MARLKDPLGQGGHANQSGETGQHGKGAEWKQLAIHFVIARILDDWWQIENAFSAKCTQKEAHEVCSQRAIGIRVFLVVDHTDQLRKENDVHQI